VPSRAEDVGSRSGREGGGVMPYEKARGCPAP